MDAKLSLIASFDDLSRNAKVLQVGIEPEFQRFVSNQQDCLKKWCSLETEFERLHERISVLEKENDSLQTTLKHARSQIGKETEHRRFLESERDQLERQIALIRELLTDKNRKSMLNEQDREKLAFLSHNTYQSQLEGNSPSRRLGTINESAHSILGDSVYDKTEDDLDTSYLRSGRKIKRPSAPPMEDEPVKRRRSDEDEQNNSIVTTTTVTLNADGKLVGAVAEVIPQTKTLNKSFSEPALDKHLDSPNRDAESEPESEDSYLGTPGNRNQSSRRKSRGILKGTTPKTPRLRKASSAGRGLNRIHFFISKTVIKPETCAPCGKRIRFGKLAMKCKDCKATCHPDCKDNLPLPCVPCCPSTPGTTKMSGGLLNDYAPIDPPMIPAIVVHCVNEVEARGLTEVGIYRVPGAESQVKELKKEFFKGRGVPNMSHIDDINVVCGCLKDFLRGLKEPVITFSLWKDFKSAAENRDRAMGDSELYQAISQLPQSNRDTLAFLILHLIRVGECHECKMPTSNLAKVFGPTIVGYSVPEPEPLMMINETKYQSMVMEKLFEIPIDYWESFLNIDEENLYPNQFNTPQTPESRAVPGSMLGPIHTPGSYEHKSRTWGKNSFTPSKAAPYVTGSLRITKMKPKLMPPLVMPRRSVSETCL
ncbi:rac GTPase-activating protein 1-like [Ylistrum balloti]|uniref:rac GTPase-activating protein 1-like n=1 Tax=Ylistrum balloti TaxID=509963 RepID=UPI002905C6EF|nr:rac GTPase-activating protein 1-like [Ylistrum balloti]